MTKGDEQIAGNNTINCSVACLNLVDHRFLLDELKYIDCPAFEFMVYGIWTEHYSEVADMLKSGGFQFDSMHAPKQTGRLLSEPDAQSHRQALELLRNSVVTAQKLGASVVTMHLWDQNSTDPKLKRNLESLYELKDFAADHGVQISIEFIPHTKGNGYLPTARYLYENMDPAFGFTLDLEFAAWNNEIDEVARFADRISNVHIRDYNGSPVDRNGRRHYCLPGLGNTNFSSAFSELERNGYRGIYTLEARHYSTEDINDSLAMLKAAMNGE